MQIVHEKSNLRYEKTLATLMSGWVTIKEMMKETGLSRPRLFKMFRTIEINYEIAIKRVGNIHFYTIMGEKN